MASDVLVLKKNSYFNTVKFERYISNAGLLKEKRIARRKRNKVIDKILIIIAMMLAMLLMAVMIKLSMEYYTVYRLNSEIYSLENDIQKVVDNKSEKIHELIKNTKIDSLKRKAYLDLNMITPTDNHIIYFDKS